MKFPGLVFAALLVAYAGFAHAETADPQDTGLEADTVKSFSVDSKTGIAHLLVIDGGISTPSGSYDPNPTWPPTDIIFPHATDAAFEKCLAVLKGPLAPATAIVVWGHAHTNNRSDIDTTLEVTFDTISDCERISTKPTLSKQYPIDMTPLGVAVYDNDSLTVDEANHQLIERAVGAAKFGQDSAPPGTSVTIVYKRPLDPRLNLCGNSIRDSIQGDMQMEVWGYGSYAHTPTKDDPRAVTATFERVEDCSMKPKSKDGPGDPPPPPGRGAGEMDIPAVDIGNDWLPFWFTNDNAMRQIHEAVDEPYGGAALTVSDYDVINKAMSGPDWGEVQQQLLNTILPDMALKLHRIVRDPKLDDTARAKAIRVVLTGTLTDNDMSRLADWGHDERFLKMLPKNDRVKLHFLTASDSIPNKDRQAKIDEFIASAKARDDKMRKENGPPNPSACQFGEDDPEYPYCHRPMPSLPFFPQH